MENRSHGRWHSLTATLLALLSGATASHLPAQVRKPAFLTVVDADGRPLANADVTLVAIGTLMLPGPSDVVQIKTDARGRGIARVVVGRPYSAWAVSAQQSDGNYLVSEPNDEMAAGLLGELVAKHRDGGRKIEVTGVAACCPQAGRTLVHLPFPDPSLAQVLEANEDNEDEVTLPPAPWCTTWLGVRDAHGNLLQVVGLDRTAPAPSVRFRAPGETQLLVLNNTKQPVQNVTAFGRLCGMRRPSTAVIGDVSTQLWRAIRCDIGDDGAIAVPIYHDDSTDWLRLEVAEHAPQYICDRVVLSNDHEVPLAPAKLCVGLLRGLTEDMVAYAQLRASFRCSRFALQSALPVQVVGNRLQVDVPNTMLDHQLVVHLLPTQEPDASEPSRSTPKLLVLPIQPQAPESLDVDLSQLQRLRARVVTEDGNAVAGARIGVCQPTEERGHSSGPFDASAMTDLDGRIELLLDEGEWAIYATDGVRQVLQFATTTKAHDDELTLELEPAAFLTCRVIDSDGKPVRGAQLERAPKSISGFGGRLRGPQGWTRERIAHHVAQPLLERARSDHNGLLQAPVQQWRSWALQVRVRAGTQVSTPFPLSATNLDPITVSTVPGQKTTNSIERSR